MTDGYVIDKVYLNWFTTEPSKTPGAAQTSQQPSPEEGDISEASGDTSDEAETSVIHQYGGKATTATPRAWSTEQPLLESKESVLLEESGDTTVTSVFPQHHVSTATSVSPDPQQSKERDLLEGSRHATDVSIFFQHGSKHVSSVSPAWSTQQPSSESEESDSLKGSGDTNDWPIFSQHGPKPDVSKTASVTHSWSPSAAVLPGDADGSGSGVGYLSDGEIIHSSTSSSVSVSYTDTSKTSSISTPVLKRNLPPLHNTVLTFKAPIEQSGKYTKNNSAMMTTSTPLLLLSFIMVFVFLHYTRTPEGGVCIAAQCRTEDTRFVQEIHTFLKEWMNFQTSFLIFTGWLIILAFTVGVAALIMVCIAIATRDKWVPNIRNI